MSDFGPKSDIRLLGISALPQGQIGEGGILATLGLKLSRNEGVRDTEHPGA